MRSRSMPQLTVPLTLSLGQLLWSQAFAATAGVCSTLAPLAAAREVGEGLQPELQSAVAITRLAVDDPKVADVHCNGHKAFLITGMAPGATSLMVRSACSSTPSQSMVFVRGWATADLTSSRLPTSEELLPSTGSNGVTIAGPRVPAQPGERLCNDDPNFYRMFFLANGNFDKRSGLPQ